MHNQILKTFSGLSGRIGILGGSFDPVHAGHLAAARSLKEQLVLDGLVFVPAHQNPLKLNAPEASDRDRLEMLRLAVEGEAGFLVSSVELHLEAQTRGCASSYTVDTLQFVRAEAAPGSEFFLLLGSDLWPDLFRWKDVTRLFEICTVVPFVREGYEEHAAFEKARGLTPEQLGLMRAALRVVPAVDVSGTAVRRSLRGGGADVVGLSPRVAEYIAARGLYRGGRNLS